MVTPAPKAREGLKKLIVKYYELVDMGQFNSFRNIFSDDVTYDRAGKLIEGIDELILFYSRERGITGLHNIDKIIESEEFTLAKGSFEGFNRKGELVKIEFIDLFKSSDNIRINYRHTYLSTGFEVTI